MRCAHSRKRTACRWPRRRPARARSPWDHPLQAGAIGVTGSPAANALAAEADVVLAVGTRLSDFTTGSHSLFAQARLVNLNVNAFDARKWRGVELIGRREAGTCRAVGGACRAGARMRRGRTARGARRDDWRDGRRAPDRTARRRAAVRRRRDRRRAALAPRTRRRATSSSARRARCPPSCTSSGAPRVPGGYHMEYGYSCMGYEIAGGLGVKMARPDREVIVIVGDGSYLMLNSEIATSVMLGRKLIVVVLDNRGYGCINRLQQAVGGVPFNNLFDDCVQGPDGRAAHRLRRACGGARRARGEREDHSASWRRRSRARAPPTAPTSSAIETDPAHTTEEGGCWWEVAVPEVSERAEVRAGARSSTRKAGTGPDRHEREDRHQPDFVEQRRPAVARRRDAARDRADRRQARSATRASSSATSFRASRMRCARCSPRTGSRSCPGGTRAGSRGARSRRRSPRSGRTSKLLADNGAKVMVYGEVADSIQGAPQPLYKRPRFFTAAQWDAYAERLTRFARHTLAHGVRLAYHHHMGAYVETPADVDELMARVGDEVGLLFDSGHMTFAGGDAVAMLRKHVKRVCHVHCKDVRPDVIKLARNRNWSFLESVINGAFTVPGDGAIDFPALIAILREHGYAGLARRRGRAGPRGGAELRVRGQGRIATCASAGAAQCDRLAARCSGAMSAARRRAARRRPRHRRRSRRSRRAGSTSASRRIASHPARRSTFAASGNELCVVVLRGHRDRDGAGPGRGARSGSARACSTTRRRTRCTCRPARRRR